MNTNTLRARFLASDLVQSSGGGGAGMLYLRPSLLLLLILSVLIFSCDPDEPEKKPPTTQDKDKGGNGNQPVTPPEQPPPEPTAPIASLGAISDNAKKDASGTGWVSQGEKITFTATAKDTDDKEITNVQFEGVWRKRGQDEDRGFGRTWTPLSFTTNTATISVKANERVGAYELKVSATSNGKEVDNSAQLYEFTVRKSSCPPPDTKNAPTNFKAFYRLLKGSNVAALDMSKLTSLDSFLLNENKFNGEINCWDVSNVTNMKNLFFNAFEFNQSIADWDTSKVNNMDSTFTAALKFNQDISQWDTSKVNNMNSMFAAALKFNQNLSGWNVKNVADYEDFDSNARDWTNPAHKPDFPKKN